MRKLLIFLVMLAISGLCGCKISEPTEEEKAKIADMEKQIQKMESGISDLEKQITPSSSALIPSLMQARLEVDKLTVSVLRQHIAALQTGAQITVTVPISPPDKELQAALEEELRNADIELHKTRAESSLYRGGLVKDLIDVRAETQQLTIANLKQQYLRAKYGLSIPALSSNVTPREQLHGKSPNTENAQQEQPTQKEEEPQVDDPGPFDFRKVRWGMNKDDVQKREKGSSTIVDGSLAYDDKIVGKKASLFYFFDEDKLWRAAYSLSEKYSNENSYVDDYETIVMALKEKYGNPKSENTFWSKDLYRNEYQRRGMAYSVGHVTSIAVWEHENTEIVAKISGENYSIRVIVTYSSKVLQKKYFEKAREEQSSNL